MFDDLIEFIRGWYQTRDFIPLHEPRFKEIDKKYVLDAIDSTFVSSVGEYVNRFEKNLASYLGADHVIAIVNGTTALQVTLKLAGVCSGDEVITQPLTFVATANAIAQNNADPVFVDVSLKTLGLCPDALEKFLSQRTIRKGDKTVNKVTGRPVSAIVPMHTFGHPCEIKKITDLAEDWNIPVIEDAAEALGSSIGGKFCGTFGKMGILSFNGNKTITCGGGGAIITNDQEIAIRAKHLTTTAKIDHPWKFIHDEIGYNYRMPNLNAALACAQLEQLDEILKDKRKLSMAYENFFKASQWGQFFNELKGYTSNFWLNTIMTSDKKQRDDLLEKTNEAGIMTRPAWQLMPDLRMYKNCQKGDLKNARWLADRIVNLPSSARINV